MTLFNSFHDSSIAFTTHFYCAQASLYNKTSKMHLISLPVQDLLNNFREQSVAKQLNCQLQISYGKGSWQKTKID